MNTVNGSINSAAMEKNLKKQIVEAAEAVKKKVRKMRNIETDRSNILKSVFKPITEPLNKMVDNSLSIESPDKRKSFHYSKALQNDVKFDTSSPLDSDKTLKRQSNVGFNILSPKESSESQDSDNNDYDGDAIKMDTVEGDESFKTVSSGATDAILDVSSWSLTPDASDSFNDVLFGIRNDRGKLMMGSSRVVLTDDYIQVGTKKYKFTDGIKELLFKKVPNLDVINNEDLSHYKLMLQETNAHRRNFSPNQPIKSNKGRKYLSIIKPLFKLRKVSVSTDSSQPDITHQGEGLPLMKTWKKNVDYVYWDDPNELVERLKLLIASKDAGNTGLENEIISIIEELRESGIIP